MFNEDITYKIIVVHTMSYSMHKKGTDRSYVIDMATDGDPAIRCRVVFRKFIYRDYISRICKSTKVE